MPNTSAVKVLALLRKRNARHKFKDLAKLSKLSYQELAHAIAEARKLVPNLVFAKFDKTYYLCETPTWYSNQTDLSHLPLEGEIGVVSDTHLCSDAERLDIVRYAYDEFARRGVTTVFHVGDLMDGENVYRGHNQFVKVHGAQAQAKYFIEKYPKREGITTYAISGNHDCESFLKTGVDQASLVVNGFWHEGRQVEGRKDIVYLGQYAHRIILPQEVTVELLHPRGNNSYALSYKQQKRSEAMDRNLRPDVQLSGHFHMYSHVWLQGTHMVACFGLQDETEFFKRLGLPRGMGFMVLRYRIRKGVLVMLSPEVFAVQ